MNATSMQKSRKPKKKKNEFRTSPPLIPLHHKYYNSPSHFLIFFFPLSLFPPLYFSPSSPYSFFFPNMPPFFGTLTTQ